MEKKWKRVVDLLQSPDLSAMNAWMEEHTNTDHDIVKDWHPFALAAQLHGTDNLTYNDWTQQSGTMHEKHVRTKLRY